jgi:N-acetylneuraminic acid mutarotase
MSLGVTLPQNGGKQVIQSLRFAVSTILVGLLVACGGDSADESAALDPEADPAATERPKLGEGSDVVITDLMRQAASLDPVVRYEAREGEAPASVPTGDLSVARSSHTESLLHDGTVIVVGGSKDLNSPELYDPETGEWSMAGEMVTPRTTTSATALPDGTVLIAGGRGESGIIASAELYDSSSGTWSPTGDLAEARRGHTATLLQDGNVLVAGGEITGGATASAELFSPSFGTWSTASSMSTPRTGHSAVLLDDGRVLITGGVSFAGTISAAEVYDPSSGMWASAGTMAEPRTGHGALKLDDGKVLIAGGQALLLSPLQTLDSAEIYDPTTGLWSPAGVMAESRSFATVTLLGDGRVLIVGGRDKVALQSAEVFDPSTLGWSLVQGLAQVRRSHTATLLPSGKILISGGRDDGGRLASSELYDPQSIE